MFEQIRRPAEDIFRLNLKTFPNRENVEQFGREMFGLCSKLTFGSTFQHVSHRFRTNNHDRFVGRTVVVRNGLVDDAFKIVNKYEIQLLSRTCFCANVLLYTES